jgi:hypothetical protein
MYEALTLLQTTNMETTRSVLVKMSCRDVARAGASGAVDLGSTVQGAVKLTF